MIYFTSDPRFGLENIKCVNRPLTDEFENEFKTRIASGGRVYLSEIYKELGFETQLPKYHRANYAFWDKNGFHENDPNVEIILDDHIKIVDNDTIRTAIEQAYNELGSGKIQPARLFNALARDGYIDTRIGETDISGWSEILDEEFLEMDGIGPSSIKYLRRAIDILNGADPLPKQQYEVKLTFEELSSLRCIYERKQNETELLKRIINSATLVE